MAGAAAAGRRRVGHGSATMRGMAFSDDALPTWLHTTLCYVSIAPFAVPLVWIGLGAIGTRQLAPLAGPEAGQTFFVQAPLTGTAAQLAGVVLVLIALAFVALATAHTRRGRERALLRRLPWIALAAAMLLYLLVRSA